MNFVRFVQSCSRPMVIKGGFAIDKGIELLKQSQIVILDVDSTIIRKEGVDMLASYLGKEKEILSYKHEIRSGAISYEVFTEKCLGTMKPSKQACEDCINTYHYDIVDNVQEFISTCKEKGKDVYLVSGGFIPMIIPLLSILHIDRSHLFAIPILFKEDGSYAGFDHTADVARVNGKGIIAQKLRQKTRDGKGVVVNIGDGILDANAYPLSDEYIGYTGVATKPAALEKAMMIVDDFADLTEIVKNI